MYICPICNIGFSTQEGVAKHLLNCFREQNPYYPSKPAPRSEDINTIEINDDVMNFFNSFKQR